MLDAATAAFLAQVAATGAPPVHDSTPEQARAAMRARQAATPPGPPVSAVADVRIPVSEGETIGARVFIPVAPRAVVVFFHGGGWVLGDIDGFDHYGRRLAVELECAVVLVDYRLAPEHPYPVAADDAWAALSWAARARGGALPDGPLLVMGDSSGGNIAAAAAQRAVAHGPQLAAQLLIYPVLDADFDRASYTDPENQLLVDARSMRWFWDQYVPDPQRRREPAAAPLHAPLDRLPPTVIATAEHDVLRDEGEDYAARLQAVGVPVRLRRFAGQMHGFATMPVLPGSVELLAFLAQSLDDILGARSPGTATPNGD